MIKGSARIQSNETNMENVITYMEDTINIVGRQTQAISEISQDQKDLMNTQEKILDITEHALNRINKLEERVNFMECMIMSNYDNELNNQEIMEINDFIIDCLDLEELKEMTVDQLLEDVIGIFTLTYPINNNDDKYLHNNSVFSGWSRKEYELMVKLKYPSQTVINQLEKIVESHKTVQIDSSISIKQ